MVNRVFTSLLILITKMGMRVHGGQLLDFCCLLRGGLTALQSQLKTTVSTPNMQSEHQAICRYASLQKDTVKLGMQLEHPLHYSQSAEDPVTSTPRHWALEHLNRGRVLDVTLNAGEQGTSPRISK